jgi:hypothetical protein
MLNVKRVSRPLSQEFELISGVRQLPSHVEKQGTRALAIILAVLAAADAATGLVLLALWGGGRFPLGLLVGAAMLASALGFGLLARHQWVLRREWNFTADEVQHKARGLFGLREWAEPLRAYAGVLSRQEYHSGGENQSYTLYVVELRHSSNSRRSIRLYSSRSQAGIRDKQENYARLFGVPALVQTATGLEARRPDELSMSVRERVAAGSLKVAFDPSAPPPGRKLAMRVEGDTLVVWTRRGGLGKAGTAVPLVLVGVGSAAIVASVLRAFHGSLPGLVVGVVILALAAAAAVLLPRVRQELLLSRERVRSRWVHPWGTAFEMAVPAAEVEEVVVGTAPGTKRISTVQAISHTATVHFGYGLSLAEQRWVRDCIIAVISR